MSANDIQVGGSHYNKYGDLQHWDVMISLGYGQGYFCSAITKYLFRWRDKNGLQDLEKAQHYLDKYIEAVRDRVLEVQPQNTGQLVLAAHFAAHFKLDARQQQVFKLVCYAYDIEDLLNAANILRAYVQAIRDKTIA